MKLPPLNQSELARKRMLHGSKTKLPSCLVTRTRQRDRNTPVSQALHWISVCHRIEFKVLVIVFKCLHGLAPNYLAELVHVHHRDSRLRQTQHLTLSIQVSERVIGRHAFWSFGTPTLESAACCCARAMDPQTFKRTLETHIFKFRYDK